MSTRALVTFDDGNEKYEIYCHNDGYPSGVGAIVQKAAAIAPMIDPNNMKYKKQRNDTLFELPSFYVPNASTEASKLAFVFMGLCWEEGYHGCYLTKGEYGQQEFNYFVKLNGNVTVTAYNYNTEIKI